MNVKQFKMVGKVCSVIWCKMRHGPKPKFHGFPKDDRIRAEWIKMCRRDIGWEPKPYSKKCSRHFKSTDYTNKGRLKNNVIPSAPGTIVPFITA